MKTLNTSWTVSEKQAGVVETTTMERHSDRRKLVAVLYADMVGYSQLVGLDDQGTLLVGYACPDPCVTMCMVGWDWRSTRLVS